jgi:hypothetical protein
MKQSHSPWVIGAVLFVLSSASPMLTRAEAQTTWSGVIGFESRLFPQTSVASERRKASASIMTEPEYYKESRDGRNSFTFKGFARLDQADSARSHADIRELHWQRQAPDWKLRVGFSKAFWGVTELLHLVDIVNQTDLVEEPRGEKKLGQPMVGLTVPRSWGTVDILFLPIFRERTFPGQDGRLRPSPEVGVERAWLKGRFHPDFAVRWSHSVRWLDIGVSHFRGIGREPDLEFEPQGPTGGVLEPRYRVVQQTGLDAQATVGPWLFKLETIYRTDGPRDFTASTGGVEYTFVGVAGSKMDLGVLAEYMIDRRGFRAPTPFASDVFTGIRLAFNDVDGSELLAGNVVDYRNGSVILVLEATRRLSDHWKLKCQSFAFAKTSPRDIIHALRKDSYVEISLNYHF